MFGGGICDSWIFPLSTFISWRVFTSPNTQLLIWDSLSCSGQDNFLLGTVNIQFYFNIFLTKCFTTNLRDSTEVGG